MQTQKDKVGWTGEFLLTKYNFGDRAVEGERDLNAGLSHESILEKYGKDSLIESKMIGENLALNSGLNLLTTLFCGGAGTAYSNGNARIGVGDDNTAASAAQTGLIASSNKTYKAMDVSYPTYGTSQQMVFRATFGSTDANYAWQEFTVDNGTTSANRLVSSQGTKSSGQVWNMTVTVTLS